MVSMVTYVNCLRAVNCVEDLKAKPTNETEQLEKPTIYFSTAFRQSIVLSSFNPVCHWLAAVWTVPWSFQSVTFIECSDTRNTQKKI